MKAEEESMWKPFIYAAVWPEADLWNHGITEQSGLEGTLKII